MASNKGFSGEATLISIIIHRSILIKGSHSGVFAPIDLINDQLALECCLSVAVCICADLGSSLPLGKQIVVAAANLGELDRI